MGAGVGRAPRLVVAALAALAAAAAAAAADASDDADNVHRDAGTSLLRGSSSLRDDLPGRFADSLRGALPGGGEFTRRTPEQREAYRERRMHKAKARNDAWLESVARHAQERDRDAAAALLREAAELHDEEGRLIELRYAPGGGPGDAADREERRERRRQRREVTMKKRELEGQLGMRPDSSSRKLRRRFGSGEGADEKPLRSSRSDAEGAFSLRQRRQEMWRERTLKRAVEKGVSEEGLARLKVEISEIAEKEQAMRELRAHIRDKRSEMTEKEREEAKEERSRLRKAIREGRRHIREELKGDGGRFA